MKCECGGDMKHHDKAVRIVREKGGAKHRIYIERVKCEKCGKTEQHWIDVDEKALEELKTGKSFLLKWEDSING